jgi:hypothetical protein
MHYAAPLRTRYKISMPQATPIGNVVLRSVGYGTDGPRVSSTMTERICDETWRLGPLRHY